MTFLGFPFSVYTWTSLDLTLRNKGMLTSLAHHSIHPIHVHSFIEVPLGSPRRHAGAMGANETQVALAVTEFLCGGEVDG